MTALLCLLTTLATPDEQALMGRWLGEPGPWRIVAMLEDWRDERRGRTLPVKLFFPSRDGGPFPVILLSGGLGSTRDGYDYLGRHWASHGMLVICLQHPGSDLAIFDGVDDPAVAMRRVADDPDYLLQRPLDMRFAFDEVLRLSAGTGPLAGRANPEMIAVAGHSFGAYAAMALAGMVIVTPTDELRLGDPRVRAAVLMSPPVPDSPVEPERLYGGMTVPALHLTATGDVSPVGETPPERRRLPFDSTPAAARYLVTFRGGDHFIFAGWRGPFGDGSKDERFHELIEVASVAFLDAHLKGDASALDWLVSGGLKQTLGRDGRLEIGPPR